MRAGQLISGYRLYSDGTTANGGRSVWAFGTKDGKEFFIKQFLSPKYPVPGEALGSETRKRKLREKCERFEQQQNRFMDVLKKRIHADGNLTVPVEFTRVGPFYYKISPKIDVSSLRVEDIAKLPSENKLSITKTAAHCVKTLHKLHIAHGDLKPNNILINKTEKGDLVAKLIDFDDSFFEGEISENPEEVVGDFVYYSPELIRYIKEGGDELRDKVSCRSDIFALGIIYYQYLSGRFPSFNRSKYQYLAASVLAGKRPGLSRLRLRNKRLLLLISDMLSINPGDRPSATEILDELRGVDCGGLGRDTTTQLGFEGQLRGTLVTKARAALPPGSRSPVWEPSRGIRPKVSKWLRGKLRTRRKRPS